MGNLNDVFGHDEIPEPQYNRETEEEIYNGMRELADIGGDIGDDIESGDYDEDPQLEDGDWEDEDNDWDDDGQPDEYTEWQDLHGGDDWDHGQFDNDY